MCQKNLACRAFQYAPSPGLTGQCTTGECYLAIGYELIDNPQTFAGPKFCGKFMSARKFSDINVIVIFDSNLLLFIQIIEIR